jgi:hypothetical protein
MCLGMQYTMKVKIDEKVINRISTRRSVRVKSNRMKFDIYSSKLRYLYQCFVVLRLDISGCNLDEERCASLKTISPMSRRTSHYIPFHPSNPSDTHRSPQLETPVALLVWFGAQRHFFYLAETPSSFILRLSTA